MPNIANAVAAIYRYPVKGLSAEKMHRVALTPGECLPHDRRFAIALGSTPFDPEHPLWLSKSYFLMLMRDEKLAQLQTRFDAESDVLEVAENGQVGDPRDVALPLEHRHARGDRLGDVVEAAGLGELAGE